MTTMPIGPVGPVVSSPSSSTVDTPVPTAPQIAPTSALAPQAAATVTAVDAAVRAAAENQGGLGALMADLGAALQTPGLPQPVQAAAAEVLALQLPTSPAPTAADLRQALSQSGLFLEAQLATGAPPGPDLKASLLRLGQALQDAPDAPPDTTQSAAPAPPYRDGPVSGQPPVPPSFAAGASADVVVQRLLHETGGAVARQVLLQVASLPGAPRPGEPKTAQWLFEVPVATPQGVAIAQFEIGRDGGREGGDGNDETPVWRARFSLDAPPMGPVHAKIAMSGGSARITLWAENADTAGRLRSEAGQLTQALVDDDVTAQVAVYAGAPSAPAPPAPGQFVDQAS
jgi:hypothetical protein